MKKLIKKLKMRHYRSWNCYFEEEDYECPMGKHMNCKYKDVCDIPVREYSYNIVFTHKNGKGNAYIKRDKKITSFADLDEVKETIEKDSAVENVIILNAMLLDD